jgi:hypothetical protein
VIFLESSLKDVSCAPYPSLCLYNVVLDDNIRTPYTCKKIRYIAFETKTGKKKGKEQRFWWISMAGTNCLNKRRGLIILFI